MALIVTNGVATSTVDQIKPRATLEVQGAVAGVAVQVPVGEIAFVDLAYTAAAPVFAAESLYVSPLVEAELDRTGRYRIVFLTVQMLDGTRLQVNKGARDTVSLSDYSERSVDKRLLDLPVIQEDLSFSLAKHLTDAFGLPDDVAKFLAKPLLDAFTTTDVQSAHLYKLLSDGFALNDSLDTSDGLLYQVIKNVANVVFAAEAHQIDLSKLLKDAASLIDLPMLTVSKPVADQVTQADNATRHTDKALNDVAAATDYLYRAVTKSLSESLLAVDVFNKTLNKGESDSVAMTDFMVRTLILIRSLSDTSLVSDSPVLQSIKTISDIALTADAFLKQPSLFKTEAITSSDSGKLVSQGYCDFSYFAEDYVGAIRSF